MVLTPPHSPPFSECSLNSLNCVDISGRHADRSLVHTPPNQDGRATPSPEHALTADSEEMNSFDDDSPPRDIHGGVSHTTASASTNTKSTRDKEPTDENFNSFHYWRSPLPDISGELEMMNCPKSSQQQQQQHEEEEQEDKDEREEAGNHFPESKSSPGKATSDQIQKVLDCLQPHMDDPDVQGQ